MDPSLPESSGWHLNSVGYIDKENRRKILQYQTKEEIRNLLLEEANCKEQTNIKRNWYRQRG